MNTTFTAGVQLTTISCSCGGVYAITEKARAEHQLHGTCWNCPYCKIGWGYSEGIKAKLERENNRLRHQIDQKEAAIAEKRQQLSHALNVQRTLSGHITRVKNRVKNGVCPCCTRSFANLRAHMATKHPGYASAEVAK